MTGLFDGGPLGPMCPMCPADVPHRVIPTPGIVGGWYCENCEWVFFATPGESQHPRNQRRREIWILSRRRRCDDPATTSDEEDQPQVTRPTTSTRAEGGAN